MTYLKHLAFSSLARPPFIDALHQNVEIGNLHAPRRRIPFCYTRSIIYLHHRQG